MNFLIRPAIHCLSYPLQCRGNYHSLNVALLQESLLNIELLSGQRSTPLNPRNCGFTESGISLVSYYQFPSGNRPTVNMHKETGDGSPESGIFDPRQNRVLLVLTDSRTHRPRGQGHETTSEKPTQKTLLGQRDSTKTVHYLTIACRN
jgi:hypothetical protein